MKMLLTTGLRYAARYRLAASLLFLACFALTASRYSEAEVKEMLKGYQIEQAPIFTFKWRTD
jgi:hypothetical protein